MKIMTRFNATFKNFIFVALLITALVTVLVFGMPVSVDAYDEIDTTSPVTLAVEFLSGSKISGMEFRAYKVANMNLNVTFEFTEEFSGYNITMARNQAGYRAMAETLASYIERDGIEPCKIAVTDETGRADFGVLERGLYLVMAPRYVSEEQKMANVVTPCLVALPNSIDGETWMYDVTVSPKITEVPVPQEGAGKTNITVETDWTEENTAGKRPSEITVELISKGSVISEVKLNSKNNWSYTWEALDAGEVYFVTEKNVPSGYTVTVTRDGNTYTINNNGGVLKDDKPAKTPNLPRTGQLWWPIPVISGFLFVVLIGIVVKKKLS